MFEKLTISTEDSEVFLQLLLHWTVKDTKLLIEATVESTKLKNACFSTTAQIPPQQTLACSDYT